MTEISNSSRSAQVVDLQAAAKTQRSGGIDRFAAALAPKTVQQPASGAGSVGKTPSGDANPLEKAAKALEDFVPAAELAPNTKLRIDKDAVTGRFVYQNVDKESGEVVKQFPPERLLEFLSYYRDLEGLAVDDKA